MNGYGSHTFKWVNKEGKAHWVKFHFKTDQVGNWDTSTTLCFTQLDQKCGNWGAVLLSGHFLVAGDFEAFRYSHELGKWVEREELDG
jgi:hypothetical protein